MNKNNKMGKSFWFVPDGNGFCSVEDLALFHLTASHHWKGYHDEGSLLTTIYGLLFWDIIFSDIPFVFQNSFQTHPLDYFTQDFYESRKDSIEKRLNEESAFLSIIKDRYLKEHPSQTYCIGINWDYHLDDILNICDCLGSSSLSNLMKVYATSLREFKSGFPDLTLWNNELKSVKFVEVKGPGDSLRPNQISWIRRLQELNIPVFVCLVKDDEYQ